MWKKRLMNLFSQFHENADKIPNSKAMGYLPKKWKKPWPAIKGFIKHTNPQSIQLKATTIQQLKQLHTLVTVCKTIIVFN